MKTNVHGVSAMLVSALVAGWTTLAGAQSGGPGADFPEGAGKSLVVPMCNSCHDINRLKAGYTPEGWHTVMRMMQNMDVPLPADKVPMVTEYLIKSFPERARPVAATLEGSSKATLKMFPVTTPASRPH